MQINPTGKGKINIGSKIIKTSQQRDRDLVPHILRQQEEQRRREKDQARIDHGKNRDLVEHADLGPPAGSAAPVSPINPDWQNLPRLTGSTVTLMGSSLDITNGEYSISLPLTPDQIAQIREELGG